MREISYNQSTTVQRVKENYCSSLELARRLIQIQLLQGQLEGSEQSQDLVPKLRIRGPVGKDGVLRSKRSSWRACWVFQATPEIPQGVAYTAPWLEPS
jgi:hypothetical protein